MQPSVVVLKFGSSVLRTAEDLPRVVDEVYRYVRTGRHVVAIVSAFAGETDRLLKLAAADGIASDRYAVATLAATGEQYSAARLSLALDRHGIPARVLLPSEIRLRAQGDPFDSAPLDVDRECLVSRLGQVPVSVIPGFTAIDAQGRTVLLGRGGSDLSAIFIAQRLHAPCVLIKDVDGLFTHDPARPGPKPARFSAVSWARALEVGGELIQPKAIEWSRAHQWPFDIAALGSAHGTQVNGGDSFTVVNHHAAPLRVALAGLGTVGRGVYERLCAYPEHFSIERILVRHPDKHLATGVPAKLLTTDPTDLLRADAELLIEALIPGAPALGLTLAALAAGRRVVSANKANLAEHWQSYRPHLEGDLPRLRCSAAVGGAVPILEVIAKLKDHANVLGVRAVLNGTCNFVLERMHAGGSYDVALSEAQALGFAEADPHLDVAGLDAASKLVLIALTTFGEAPAALDVQGIDRLSPLAIQSLRGGEEVLKLIGTVEVRSGRVRARVGPTVLPKDDFLAGARLEENRFEILLEGGRSVELRGRGAGRWPTSTAVMGDVWTLARELRSQHSGTLTARPPWEVSL